MTDSLQHLVDSLHSVTGLPTTLADLRCDLITHAEHGDSATDKYRSQGILERRADPAARAAILSAVADRIEVTRVPANTSIQFMNRLVIPIVSATKVVAYVIILDPENTIEASQATHMRDLCVSLAGEIERAVSAPALDTKVIQKLISNETATRADGLASVETLTWWGPNTCFTPLILTPPSNSLTSALIRKWKSFTDLRGFWGIIESDCVVILKGSGGSPLEFASKVQREALGSSTLVNIGIGPSALLHDLYRSFRRARLSLFASKSLGSGAITEWDSLGAWRLILSLPHDDLLDLVDKRVSGLIESEEDYLVDLAVLYSKSPNDVGSVSRTMHVHRSTVYNRLDYIYQTYNLDLKNADDRLATILGSQIFKFADALSNS